MAAPEHPAIKVDQLSLSYRVTTEKVKSIKEYAIRRLNRSLPVSTFWALRDVSFEVQPGEVFGVIGRNGAGKTTLLKVIARVLRPTSGKVVVRGLTAPLLGLGAGFNEELTGRENVFLVGATLGFSYQDMKSRLGRIIDFAELDDFIDAPLRTFSTGMRARLGFAIATDVEPQVLLLDEIMSVGDQEFKRRCNQRIEDFRKNGATVVLVSHALETVTKLCDRTLLLGHGQSQSIGTTKEVVAEYRGSINAP
jgi:ABC-type polysaccharide/polyol phosphate transport system ATPase subunit